MVTLIIGILAAIGIPQYVKTMEASKADDAIALVQMIATANRMYGSDNGFVYVNGLMERDDTNCASCSACPIDEGYKLVKCNYLAAQDWSRRPFQYHALNGASSCGDFSAGCPAGFEPGNLVACALRKDRTSFSEGAKAPYNTWKYAADRNGIVCGLGTNVPPPL